MRLFNGSSYRSWLSTGLMLGGVCLGGSSLAPFAAAQDAKDEQPAAPAAKNQPAEAEPAEADEPANPGKYEELKIPAGLDERGKVKVELSETRQRVNGLFQLVRDILTGAQPLTGNQKNFDGYFLQYKFPQMTWVSQIEGAGRHDFLYQQRKQLRDLLRQAQSAPVHDHLVQITLPKMTEIAKGNYHPAARMNAMLIIGDLNRKEVVQAVPPQPPEPLVEALPVMMDELADPKQLDIVKVAAMLGILRHVQADVRQRGPQGGAQQPQRIDDATRDRINQLTLEILNQKDPPEGRTPDGHAWMQRRAIDILAVLGAIGTNVNAAQRIEAIVADDTLPLSLRCGAAEALGQLNLPPETKLDPVVTARKLGDLAVFSVKKELKRLEDEKKFYDEKKKSASGGAGGLGGMPGGAGPGAMPGGAAPGAMPGGAGGFDGPLGSPGGGGVPGTPGFAGGSRPKVDEYKLETAHRRIRAEMQAVKVGLAGIETKSTGILGLTKDAKQKDQIQKLVDAVKDVRSLTDVLDKPATGADAKPEPKIDPKNPKTDLDLLAEDLAKRVKLLEAATKGLVAAGNPAAAPAKDGPGADGPADDGPGGAPKAKPGAKPAAAAAAPAAKPGDVPAGAAGN